MCKIKIIAMGRLLKSTFDRIKISLIGLMVTTESIMRSTLQEVDSRTRL